MREYKDCYIAFLDLLGFKNLISKKNCDYIAGVFDAIYDTLNDGQLSQKYLTIQTGDVIKENPLTLNQIHYKIMSDSICIYIESNVPNSLLTLIFVCLDFQIRMLKMETPIILRGGIIKGTLYVNEDIVFGKGLTDAYLLEEKIAKNPRIIMPMNIVDTFHFQDNDDGKYNLLMTAMLEKTQDGFYSIRYLLPFSIFDMSEHGEKLKKNIYKHLTEEFDPSVRSKYLYIQNELQKYAMMKEKPKNV